MYHGLHHLIEAENLRQDHIVSSRATDADQKVIGVQMDSTKIGGPVGGATVIIPDPMAATGSSIAAVINSYLNLAGGAPRVIAAVHLIVTPEYIRRMTAAFPALEIFAIRVDRGLSSSEALAARPGEQGIHYFLGVDPSPCEGVGELIEHIKVMALFADPAGDLGPAIGGGAGMVCFRTRLLHPGPAGSHFVPFHGPADSLLGMQPSESFEDGLLADFPLGALDELEHRDVHPGVPGS
jgi:hypothetical protein